MHGIASGQPIHFTTSRKKKNLKRKRYRFLNCCPTRIRTWTGRTKICSATVTPSDNFRFNRSAKVEKNSNSQIIN